MHHGQPLQKLYKLLENLTFCTVSTLFTSDVTPLQAPYASQALIHTVM